MFCSVPQLTLSAMSTPILCPKVTYSPLLFSLSTSCPFLYSKTTALPFLLTAAFVMFCSPLAAYDPQLNIVTLSVLPKVLYGSKQDIIHTNILERILLSSALLVRCIILFQSMPFSMTHATTLCIHPKHKLPTVNIHLL